MELGKLLTEGKGKRVYATDDPDQAIVYFKDEAMAFHGLKRGRILGKGEVNNAISEQFFKMLEENGIPTHYLRRLDARQSLVKRCQILPVSVKVNCSLRMKSALIPRASGMPGRMSRWISTASAVIWAALSRRIRICCTG